ncbi:MAG TPA: phosphoribosylformylglycinamidine synthase [Rhodospirillaceae bacterium]|jgi:phosphoribosylformylglycinamidine synthase II|nr:phosphoribosylformylglycinamidine synthase [Alphaproteobacteria bacterium]HBH26365.1 phosphoribosylformylglycinamidine synthase [Rhodospirillaceae bacterium]
MSAGGHRTLILGPETDGRAGPLLRHLPPGAAVRIVDVYTTKDKPPEAFARALACPVTQEAVPEPPTFAWAVEVGFLPGVADNVGATAAGMLEALGAAQDVYFSRLYLLSEVGEAVARSLLPFLANPLIHRVTIFNNINSFSAFLPVVDLDCTGDASACVNLEVSDEELSLLSSKGIENRGPLGLPLPYLHTIRDYFRAEGRKPRDIEVEMLAQSWSEHCKHNIFASPLDDDVPDGLYKHYIKRATQDIRAAKGERDFCISVFTDNAGGIAFDERWMVCDKVETHNTPCSLEPFGGAVTGIGGVNRDIMGFGLGAKPIANRYGFCFAPLEAPADYYRDLEGKIPVLSPEIVAEGVIHGVEHGGNCAGIPTPQGFAYYDARCVGKPLVFVGTVGLAPRTIRGKPAHIKAARPGDFIVTAGGRVGLDGIHGATFSSVALDEGAPATAVQIGDPITQKKLSDALLEVRGRAWWTSITDNGAGGLSSSVGEMGRDPGGFVVEMDKVPLKYPGLKPWQIWISESQERMTLSVPPEHADALIAHLASRGVEAAVIGRFTDSGRAVATWEGEEVLNLSMDFIHDGTPTTPLTTTFTPGGDVEPKARTTNMGDALLDLLARPNMRSREAITTRFDHGVQGGAALGPLQGPGRVSADATVIRPLFDSTTGVVLAHGLFPRYGDIDTGAMAAASLDYAVRAAVAAGCPFDHLALLDNFCWCSSTDPARLGQLKRACAALYEAAVAYGTPFISGKDSMFNDFKGYDASGHPVTISAPPTTLISALGVMPDTAKAVSLTPKAAGDRLYLLGATHDECGGSEYYAMRGALGRNVPQTRLAANRALYADYSRAVARGLIASALPLGLGGLAAALAKKAIASGMGLEVDLSAVDLSPEKALFSESTGRILVTVVPAHDAAFQKGLANFARPLGHVSFNTDLHVAECLTLPVESLAAAYR